jgi:hypothetical protein
VIGIVLCGILFSKLLRAYRDSKASQERSPEQTTQANFAER